MLRTAPRSQFWIQSTSPLSELLRLRPLRRNTWHDRIRARQQFAGADSRDGRSFAEFIWFFLCKKSTRFTGTIALARIWPLNLAMNSIWKSNLFAIHGAPFRKAISASLAR